MEKNVFNTPRNYPDTHTCFVIKIIDTSISLHCIALHSSYVLQLIFNESSFSLCDLFVVILVYIVQCALIAATVVVCPTTINELSLKIKRKRELAYVRVCVLNIPSFWFIQWGLGSKPQFEYSSCVYYNQSYGAKLIQVPYNNYYH